MVTANEAVMFTDGRYFLQAEKELFPGWKLMRMGLPDTPSENDWIRDAVPASGAVGVDPSLLSAPKFRELGASLEKVGKRLVAVDANLVDEVWGGDRPPRPRAKVCACACV